MFSEKDFEILWFFYKTEGEPKGVSISSFCIGNNIPYSAFFRDYFCKLLRELKKERTDYENLLSMTICK